MAMTCLCRRWLRSDDPRFGRETPNRIAPMDLIDRARLHIGRILASAQRRRDARHHVCGDALDIARGRTVHAAAENRSAEHTSEPQSLMRISYAGFRLTKQKTT